MTGKPMMVEMCVEEKAKNKELQARVEELEGKILDNIDTSFSDVAVDYEARIQALQARIGKARHLLTTTNPDRYAIKCALLALSPTADEPAEPSRDKNRFAQEIENIITKVFDQAFDLGRAGLSEREEQLEEAIRKYGLHQDDCLAINIRPGPDSICTCGLADALKKEVDADN